MACRERRNERQKNFTQRTQTRTNTQKDKYQNGFWFFCGPFAFFFAAFAWTLGFHCTAPAGSARPATPSLLYW
jgi:hypothetical protein